MLKIYNLNSNFRKFKDFGIIFTFSGKIRDYFEIFLAYYFGKTLKFSKFMIFWIFFCVENF